MSTATETADIIRQQITPGVLMSLGAQNIGAAPRNKHGECGLDFSARVLPFTVGGARSPRPRIMVVFVALTADDAYRIEVYYKRAGKLVCHFHAAGVYADQLPQVLLDLDSDTDLQDASVHHENRVTG